MPAAFSHSSSSVKGVVFLPTAGGSTWVTRPAGCTRRDEVQPCHLWLMTKARLSSPSDWVQTCFPLGVTFSHWSQFAHGIHPGVWQHDSWSWGLRLADRGGHAFDCSPDCLFLGLCGACLMLTSGLAYMQGLQWVTQSPGREDWHFLHLFWRSQTENSRLHSPYVSSGVANAQERMDSLHGSSL